MAAKQMLTRRRKNLNDAMPCPRRLHVESLEDRRLLSATRAVEAVNHFALDAYEHMQREDGNLFFSPLSIASGLAMAYAGAAEQTAAEIEQVVHLGSEPGIHASFAELVDSIESHNEVFAFPKLPHVLTVANAIWPDDALPVEQGFLDIIQGEYAGHVQTVDYANPQQAKDTINQWVSNNTRGKIPALVDNLTADTRMVLTNAVYFNGYWKFPFDPLYTQPRDFTLPDGQTRSVPMMYTEIDTPYTILDGFQVLEVPFEPGLADADYSMVFVLPPESGDQDLSRELVSQIDAWLDDSPAYTYVLLSLPKVDTAVSTGLNQLLMGLGMPTAFELGAADFSAMTPEPVAIREVFHKATLTMNEQGTTAAAATRINFGICFAAGTSVLTPDGTESIERLKPGDLVLARDENNLEGELGPKVVGKVHHSEAAIVEVQVRGQVIRTTAPHPLFVQGKGWTPAGELQPGDKLSTSSYDWAEVEAVEFTQQVEPVYNLRVADYHTYFVQCEEWDFAVWVHNACGGEPEFFADRPYHLLIRDNITGAIAFMGRINDPIQLQNDVVPTVVAGNADFDGSQLVDGGDFLAWQRGHGTTQDAQLGDGDSDADGDVDGDDLSNWERSYGDSHGTPAAQAGPADSPLATLESDATTLTRGLVDAALALEWLDFDTRDRAMTIVESPAATLPAAFATAFDDQPVAAPRAAIARASLASRGDDSQFVIELELDDETLDLAFD